MSSGCSLTYGDAAVVLGMSYNSVKNRARREGWEKQFNDEGRVTILVPSTAIVDAAASRAPTPPPVEQVRWDLILDLMAQIADLGAKLDELSPVLEQDQGGRRTEVDHVDRLIDEFAGVARKFTDGVATANDRSDAERARADALEAERDASLSKKDREIDRLKRDLAAVVDVIDWSRLPGHKRMLMTPPTPGMFFDVERYRTRECG